MTTETHTGYLTTERRMLQEAARDFAMQEVLPLANKLDPERGDMPRSLIDKMAELGVPKISIDDAMLNLRQQSLTALAFWTITLRPAPGMPPMQPESISYEFIKRLVALMDDHDALDAFH